MGYVAWSVHSEGGTDTKRTEKGMQESGGAGTSEHGDGLAMG